MAISVKTPFAQFFGLDGHPLENGSIFFGVENQDPEQFPTSVYWDEAALVPAAQPVRTISGYLDRNGAPAVIFANGAVSIKAKNSLGEQVFYAPSVFGGNVGVINISQVVGAFRNVKTIAELRALSKLTNTNAFVAGYYTAGDGGGGPYWLDATDISSSDNGGTIIVANDGGRWKLQHVGVVSWKQFGAKMDGVADDWQAIQNGINALDGEFFGPPGNARITATLTINKSGFSLVGSGETATTITGAFADGDIIAIGNGVVNPGNSCVRDMSISSIITKTSGAAIRFRNGHSLYADHIRLLANMYDGFALDGGAQQFLYYVSNFEINSGSHGFIIGETGFVQDVWIGPGIIDGATDAGMILLNVSGFYFDRIDFINCKAAFSTFPGAGQKVQAGFMTALIADTSRQNGFHILTNGGGVYQLNFNNCWASTNGTDNVSNTLNNGVYINPGAGAIDGLSFSSLQAVNNNGSGFRLGVGGGAIKNINISDPQIYCNSLQGVNARAGVEIEASITDWSIIGGSIGRGGVFDAVANNQSYGIDVFAGTGDVYTIHGVNLTGNGIAGMRNLATGTVARSIVGNPGFKNANQGAAVLAGGTTSIVVNHGLDVTPAPADLVVVPAQDMGASIARWWADTITATQFTIRTNASTAGTTQFTWWARVMGA